MGFVMRLRTNDGGSEATVSVRKIRESLNILQVGDVNYQSMPAIFSAVSSSVIGR